MRRPARETRETSLHYYGKLETVVARRGGGGEGTGGSGGNAVKTNPISVPRYDRRRRRRRRLPGTHASASRTASFSFGAHLLDLSSFRSRASPTRLRPFDPSAPLITHFYSQCSIRKSSRTVNSMSHSPEAREIERERGREGGREGRSDEKTSCSHGNVIFQPR